MNTEKYIAKKSGANLIVLEEDHVGVYTLDIQPEWIIGRYDPNMSNVPDILFKSPIVSRVHGWLRNIENQWYFVDNPKNLNGTFYNGVKISRPLPGIMKPIMLENNDILRIDNGNMDHTGGIFMVFTTTAVKGTWTSYKLNKSKITIGRGTECNIIVPIPYISTKHAEIFYANGQYYLADCDSTAGTFLNGKLIHGPCVLHEKDYITLCDWNFIYLGNKILYVYRDRKHEQAELEATDVNKRPVILKANIKTKRVKNNKGSGKKEIIKSIELEIRQGTLVALLGTAGAGKTTVMNCLDGMDLDGVEGSIFYDDVNLLKNFNQIKYRIGIVPQEKTFHPDFTPQKEFEFAAEKRLPADTSKYEIRKRVSKTLNMLGIDNVRNNFNRNLSGGEQTRVNIGIELVADRDLLCMDEPDQGLDPNYKHEVFQIMQDLAHKNGKTIISIIHDVSEIDLFDQVIMLVKVDNVGRLAFSGTPSEMRHYFGVQDIREIYTILEKNPTNYI